MSLQHPCAAYDAFLPASPFAHTYSRRFSALKDEARAADTGLYSVVQFD